MGVLTQSAWAGSEFRLRNTRGGAVVHRSLPVAASQTIYKGQLLKCTDGLLVQALATSLTSGQAVDSGGTAGGVLLYVALCDYTTTSTVTEADKIPVAPLSDGNEVMLQFANFPDSAGSLGAATNTTVTDTDAGVSYQIGVYYNASSGRREYGADIETTNGELEFVEDADEPTSTATYHRGWFRGRGLFTIDTTE